MTNGRNILGDITNTDVQGNAQDKNVHGERPEDAQGNAPKDIFGNETGTETEE